MQQLSAGADVEFQHRVLDLFQDVAWVVRTDGGGVHTDSAELTACRASLHFHVCLGFFHAERLREAILVLW